MREQLEALTLDESEFASARAKSTGAQESREPNSALPGKVTKHASEWLTIRRFSTAEECVAALRELHFQVWVTVLSQDALDLHSPSLRVPPPPTRLAVVFGSESLGVSSTMVAAAHRKVYFPLHGFSESLNLR